MVAKRGWEVRSKRGSGSGGGSGGGGAFGGLYAEFVKQFADLLVLVLALESSEIAEDSGASLLRELGRGIDLLLFGLQFLLLKLDFLLLGLDLGLSLLKLALESLVLAADEQETDCEDQGQNGGYVG